MDALIYLGDERFGAWMVRDGIPHLRIRTSQAEAY